MRVVDSRSVGDGGDALERVKSIQRRGRIRLRSCTLSVLLADFADHRLGGWDRTTVVVMLRLCCVLAKDGFPCNWMDGWWFVVLRGVLGLDYPHCLWGDEELALALLGLRDGLVFSVLGGVGLFASLSVRLCVCACVAVAATFLRLLRVCVSCVVPGKRSLSWNSLL